MRILGPKFVKRANAWCVTLFKELHSAQSKKSSDQTQHFFTTEQEAQEFIHSQSIK